METKRIHPRYVAKEFSQSSVAINYIKTKLFYGREFQGRVILKLNKNRCVNGNFSWDIFDVYLNALNSLQGKMIFTGIWDFDDTKPVFLPTEDNEIFIVKNSGVIVINDLWAMDRSQIPIIVIRKEVWRKYPESILDLLSKEDKPAIESISPAMFLEKTGIDYELGEG